MKLPRNVPDLFTVFLRQDTPPIRQSPDCFNDSLGGRPTAQDYMVSLMMIYAEQEIRQFILAHIQQSMIYFASAHAETLSCETKYSDDYI